MHAGACNGVLPGSQAPVRRRDISANGAAMGVGVASRHRRHQHDDEGERQVGHVLPFPEILRQSVVCASAPILKAGVPPREADPELRAEGGGVVLPEQRQHPPPGLLQDLATDWLQKSCTRGVTWKHARNAFVG